jgi:SAM-dependent methyltransferase
MQTTDAQQRAVPYLNFYQAHGISPVSQNIDDLARHYGRRESLYRLLGLAPNALRGRRVLELCPGSGYNSLYTQSLEPAHYQLVDGNPVAIAKAQELFAQYFPESTNVCFTQSLVQDFVADELYDFVFCEGAIMFQDDPKHFVKELCRFLAPGGVLVVSCEDSVSFFSEAARRLMAAKYSSPQLPAFERLEALRPLFTADFASLRGASRPIDDWLLDAIIHPLRGQLFSFADAVDALGELGLEMYGSSPAFRVDWRWYKDITPGAEKWNERFRSQFLQHTLNLMDYRFVREPHSEELGLQLLASCQTAWDEIQRYEDGDAAAFSRAQTQLSIVAELVAGIAPETSASLGELIDALTSPAGAVPHLPTFQSMFLSLISPRTRVS